MNLCCLLSACSELCLLSGSGVITKEWKAGSWIIIYNGYIIFMWFLFTHTCTCINYIYVYIHINDTMSTYVLFLGYLKSMGEDLVIDYKKEFDAWKKEKYLNLDGAIQILHYLL